MTQEKKANDITQDKKVEKPMMWQKLSPFLKKRLFTVAMIWLSVVLFYNIVAAGFKYMAAAGSTTKVELTPIAGFGDGRLVVVLSLAALMLMGIFSLILLNVNRGSVKHENLSKFIFGLWDEVSSASTHVGAALVASLYYTSDVAPGSGSSPQVATGTLLLAVIYFIIGYLAFYYEPPKEAVNALESPDVLE